MQALKGLVIFMGLAILAILGVIVYTVIGRFSETSAVQSSSFGIVQVTIPEGCHLAGSQSGDGRLFLRLDGPLDQDCQQILVLDLETAEPLGRITAKPER